jgi:hypothetical protein
MTVLKPELLAHGANGSGLNAEIDFPGRGAYALGSICGLTAMSRDRDSESITSRAL